MEKPNGWGFYLLGHKLEQPDNDAVTGLFEFE